MAGRAPFVLATLEQISINVSGAPVWTKPGSQIPLATCATKPLMDQQWQGALRGTPQQYETLCVCVQCRLHRWAIAFVCVHVSVAIVNRRQETPWTITKLMELSTSQCVHVYERTGVNKESKSASVCPKMCGGPLLERNGRGHCNLHHVWNATQVSLESTFHNCTWQSCAPATPPPSHWRGNTLNRQFQFPELHCYNTENAFFHLWYSIHITAYRNEHVTYIFGTVEHICMVESVSCSLWLVFQALEERGDEISNQFKICYRDDWERKKKKLYIYIGTDF